MRHTGSHLGFIVAAVTVWLTAACGDSCAAWHDPLAVPPEYSISQGARAQTESDPIVHVTASGTCYHGAACVFAQRKGVALALSEAVGKYRPCTRCEPPRLDHGSAADTATAVVPITAVDTAKRQCAAITKKGTRCKRLATPGNTYCGQHSERAQKPTEGG